MLKKIKENKGTLPAFIFIIGVFTLIALKEGFIPYISFPAMGITYPIMGTSKLLANEMSLTVHRNLFPGGAQLTEFFFPYFAIALFNRFISNIEFSIELFYFIIFISSVISFIILFNKITRNFLVSGLLAALFFIDPYFAAQSGIPPFHIGLMLMPICVLFDVFIFEKSQLLKKNQLVFVFILGYLARMLISTTTAYLAVMLGISSCLFFLIYYIATFGLDFFKRQEFKRYLFFIVVPWGLALWTMKMLMPQATDSFSSQLEMLRACSPDLLTIFFPSDNLFLSHIFSITSYLKAHGKMFAGDLTMWQNYFGYTMIFSAIWIIFKKGLKNKVVLSLLAVGLVTLFLGLGPSLKLNSTLDATTGITGQNYSLSKEQVIADFPWYSVFKISPFNIMRAVYRWLIVPKFLLLVGFAFTLKYIADKRRQIVTVLILCLAIFEFTPKHVNLASGIDNLGKINQFKSDVIYPLKSMKFKSSDRIIFLPSENDYLVPYMSAKANFTTYNGAGDKAMALAWDSFPEPVNQILREQQPNEIAKLILEIKKKKIADFVVLTFFNSRWDSYSWPVRASSYKELKDRAHLIENEIAPEIRISYFKYFDVIELKH